jgi:hypothetical protein
MSWACLSIEPSLKWRLSIWRQFMMSGRDLICLLLISNIVMSLCLIIRWDSIIVSLRLFRSLSLNFNRARNSANFLMKTRENNRSKKWLVYSGKILSVSSSSSVVVVVRPSVPIEFPRKYIILHCSILMCRVRVITYVQRAAAYWVPTLVFIVQIVHTKKPRLTSKQNMAQIYVGTVIEFPRKVIRLAS